MKKPDKILYEKHLIKIIRNLPKKRKFVGLISRKGKTYISMNVERGTAWHQLPSRNIVKYKSSG